MENFIASVHSKPCLWDMRVVDFHNKVMVRKMWEKVEKECNLQAGSASKKWKNLKDTFRRENRKVSSKWILFPELTFLKDVMGTRISSDNKKLPSNVLNSTDDKTPLECDPKNSKEGEPNQKQADEGNRKRRHHSESEFLKSDNSKKTKTIDQKVESTVVDSEKCDDNDDDFHFLMSFRAYLRQMSDQKKLKFRIRMQELVYDIMYGDDSPQTRNSSIYFSEQTNCNEGNNDVYSLVEYEDVKPIIND